MRHLKAGNRLGVTSAHRLAMMRNMVTSIIENGQITCTLARAKEARKPLEKMIGLGKKGTLHSRRQALRFVKSKEAMAQLFGDLAIRYKDRNGGYCRVIKLGKTRLGDNSEMAIIQLLGSEGDKLSDLKSKKPIKKKQKKKGSTVLKEVSEEIQQVPESVENAEKELKQENVQESGKKESPKTGDEHTDPEKNESMSKDTSNSENKSDKDEKNDESAKNNLEEKNQADTAQVHEEPNIQNTETEKNESTSKDTSNSENKSDKDEKNDESAKNNLKEKNQADTAQVHEEPNIQNTETEKNEPKLNQDKTSAGSQQESTDELEEDNK